ncbi:hypothetical protein BGZ98_008710 [Dissophora globulifera]|nr:hypothetical protein BGZ98_008710 [Dissophora globulifera]
MTEAFSVKKESPATPPGEQAQVLQFNRNSEQLIEGYFKEGMDATGVEMFDILLGPHRRPTKEFIASFFYAVILSPLTEPATIEAAIHVLDRTLTIHGPEPFQNIWDVQKRRREIADGTNAFSRLSSSSSSGSIITAGLGSGMSTRSSVGGGSEASLSASNVTGASSIPLSKGRLPSWNTMWDLIRAEFGLDTRPESKHHIALQEYHIRMRLQGEDLIPEPSTIGKAGQGDEDLFQEDEGAQGVREEQEVRDEIGRAIVGLLLRILEQDAVLKNVSSMSYFCHNVLMTDPYSPMHTVRPALDTAFQIISLATSSRYLEPPPPPKTGRDSTAVGATGESIKATRPSPSWPLQEHYTLNAAGMEILQLGQQFLLLLIRFTEAGQLLPGKGMEELAREALSRLSKVNRDRKAPVVSGSNRSGTSTGAGAGLGTPFFLERCNLDQTEIFLKTLIQGPCLLDAGTGSGSGVKLRRENSDQQKENTGGSGQEYSISADDYNGILKSQTGICVGSSAFVMTLVDLWFRSKTTAGGSTQMSFRRVVEEYARPGTLRPSAVTAATTAVTGPKNEKLRVSKRRRTTKGRKPSQPPSDEDNDEDEVLESREMPSSETDRGAAAEQWNAKDLEQLEWVVMMIEVLVWSWIEARGIRRDEIAGTGLERALFPEEASQDHAESNTSSGWLEMSRLLMTIGGTLQTRWEQLESIIEAAILVEDLCLR